MTPFHIPGTQSGPYPARAGNLVRPLIDGEAIARRIGEAVEAARHSVWLTVAFCSDDFLFPDGRGLLFDVLDRSDPKGAALFEGIEALAPHRGFMLAGVAEHHAGRRRARYVHAKIMLVDDAWATIGSCNLHFHSMGGNAEMNASIWDGDVVRALRCQLLARHLALDTAGLDDRAALALFRDVAGGNRGKIDRREDGWQGLAFALSPHGYARETGVKADLT